MGVILNICKIISVSKRDFRPQSKKGVPAHSGEVPKQWLRCWSHKTAVKIKKKTNSNKQTHFINPWPKLSEKKGKD